mgnify:CR=1 FL=1
MKVWKLDADMSEYESFKLKKEDKAFLRNFKKEMSNGEKKKGKLFFTQLVKSSLQSQSDSKSLCK